jgi:hypothetical protein
VGVAVLFFVAGAGRFEANGVALAGAILFYLLGGGAAGAVAGLFREVPKGPLAKLVVAFLVALPVSFGAILVLEAGDFSSVRVPSVLLGTLLFGLMGAGVFWDDY